MNDETMQLLLDIFHEAGVVFVVRAEKDEASLLRVTLWPEE
jgi:hypothetical protein